MAQSTCVKCGATTFELKEARNLQGAECEWDFIQCASCGCVVGIVDVYPNAKILDSLDKMKTHLGIP